MLERTQEKEESMPVLPSKVGETQSAQPRKETVETRERISLDVQHHSTVHELEGYMAED